MQKKMSRRDLFKIIASLFTFSGLSAWGFGTNRKISIAKGVSLRIPKNLEEGITFMDKIIIHKESEKMTVFSATCTHLGCKLTKIEDDKIICPCHGSAFSFSGEAIKGPASKPLSVLNIVKDKSGQLVVVI